MKRKLLTLLSAVAVSSAFAQSGGKKEAAKEAPVPPPMYRSAFEDYRPYQEPELASWRDVNDEMGRLGGHTGHLKKKTDAAESPAAKPADDKGQAANGHSHHGGHK